MQSLFLFLDFKDHVSMHYLPLNLTIPRAKHYFTRLFMQNVAYALLLSVLKINTNWYQP